MYTFSIYIPTISTPGCIDTLTASIQKINGVTSIFIDSDERKATIEYWREDHETFELDVKQAITGTGRHRWGNSSIAYHPRFTAILPSVIEPTTHFFSTNLPCDGCVQTLTNVLESLSGAPTNVIHSYDIHGQEDFFSVTLMPGVELGIVTTALDEACIEVTPCQPAEPDAAQPPPAKRARQ